MDFKFERFLHVDSSLSAEQQEKVRQMLLKVSRGAQQQLLGDKMTGIRRRIFQLDTSRQKTNAGGGDFSVTLNQR
jgi:hypothetical protein